MATWIQFLVTFTLLFMAAVNGTRIQATPGSITTGLTQSLTLRCTPDTSQGTITKVFSVQIQKIINNQVKVLANIDVGGSAEIKDPSLTQRATITGAVGTGGSIISGSYLQLVLTNLVCQDAGQYVCDISGKGSGGTNINHKDATNVTASAKPENIKMYVSPKRPKYSANDSVTMRCTGKVGNPVKDWVWEWKFISATTWSLYPRRDQIKYDDPSLETTGCRNNYNGGTELKYVVEDNRRIIRCSLEKNEEYSDNITIYITGQPGPLTTPKIGEIEEPSSANVGLIVGCTIGALALIIIIIVIVYFVWFRRRNTDDTREEDNKGEPHHTTPYMTDNSAYAQPKREEPKVNRRGFVNRGLDDKHTNNYANDRYDDHPDYGRTNKAMDDDGGSFGSAV